MARLYSCQLGLNQALGGGSLHHSSHSSQQQGWTWDALSSGDIVWLELTGVRELPRKHRPKKPKKLVWVWWTQKWSDMNEAGRWSKTVALGVSRACSWELTRWETSHAWGAVRGYFSSNTSSSRRLGSDRYMNQYLSSSILIINSELLTERLNLIYIF